MKKDGDRWRTHPGGPELELRTVTSPWTGWPEEAVVNLDTNEVIAIAGATCAPFFLVPPTEKFMGELREAGLPSLPSPKVIALPGPNTEEPSE